MNMDFMTFCNGERTMTSREIAELTSKRHKRVLRDIEVMLDELGLDCIDFAVALPDSHGRMKPSFHLPKRETLILLTRFPRPVNQRVIDQWEAWEALETDKDWEAWEDWEACEALETDKATPAAVPTNRASEDMVVLSALETGKAVPAAVVAQPYSAAVEAIQVADALAKMLRLEGSARLDVAQKAVKIRAPDLLPMVPVYAIDAK
jgi:phage regulator Rha-like protein